MREMNEWRIRVSCRFPHGFPLNQWYERSKRNSNINTSITIVIIRIMIVTTITRFHFEFKSKNLDPHWNFGPASLWDCRLLPGACGERISPKPSTSNKHLNSGVSVIDTVRWSDHHFYCLWVFIVWSALVKITSVYCFFPPRHWQ